MNDASKSFLSDAARVGSPAKEPSTPQSHSGHLLTVPVVSPLPGHRFSPVLDEFSLRRTPSRGGTASPAPAKGVRKRLNQHRNFSHAVDLIRYSTNVVVLTGAGISTSVGIPDFRSDKGLYSQLSKDLGITEAEEFFSRDYFVHNTDTFFRYVKRVIPEAVVDADGTFRSTTHSSSSKDGRSCVPKFSPTHAFLALLHSKRKLLTNYTQNIDGLEIAAGLPTTKFVQCHGSWNTASCMTCGRSSTARRYLPVVFAGNIPYCKCKLDTVKKRPKRKTGKKRSWDEFDSDHSSDDGTRAPRGLLKPDITFFNERLSGSYDDRLNEDKRKIDLLIIIGTSLKVGPVQDMLYQISPRVPQIFISKERFSGALCNLPGVQVDIELLGECDVIIQELCRRAGWSEALKSLCWEEGQTKIKPLDTTASSAALNLSIDGNDNSPNTDDRSQNTILTGSVSGSQNEPPDNYKSKLSLQAQNTSVSKLTVAPMPMSSKIALNPSLNSSKPDHCGMEPNPRPTQIGRDLQLEKLTAIGNNSRLSNDPQSNVKVGSTNSLVKIELVEGTTHQWRVTKK